MSPSANIADLQATARRRLPKIIFDYIEGGGYEEETLRRNRRAFEGFALRPRVLNDVSRRSTVVELFGETLDMPVVLAPVGMAGAAYPNGEVHAARAAQSCGVPFCLSTLSIASIEDVAEAVQGPFWFQLYLMRDRRVSEALIGRAREAGCSTLVLTLDLHVRSRRHRDERNGLTAPPRITAANLAQVAAHPAWLLRMASSRRRTFGNLISLAPDAENLFAVTQWIVAQSDDTVSPRDVEWVRSLWPGKLLVKGVLHPQDAVLAIERGVDGVIVSNHGGRQVDGVLSTLAALPGVVEAVQGRVPVLVDSGVRSGIDVLKALSLGAAACLIGRAFMYGLAAGGEAGVRQALSFIRGELDDTMALCGVTDLRRLPEDLLQEDENGVASSS